MVLKILGLGLILNRGSYLRDTWNILDFTIVLSGYFALFTISSINFTSLRSFRVLRPLRTISNIEGLKLLVSALFSALPLLRDTIIVLIFFFIIYGIAGVQLWSGQFKRRCVDEFSGEPDYDLLCGARSCPTNTIN